MPNVTLRIPLLLILVRIPFTILTNTFHPTSIIMICLMYNVTLSIYISLWKASPIFPLIFILIIIRGLLIIFLYFAGTISNAEPCRHWNKEKTFIFITFWGMFVIYTYPFLKSYATINLNFNFIDSTSHYINIIFKVPLSSLTLIRIMYLLLCLIAIIKICSPKIKTLRKLN